ncbi:MAG: hypothetical protein A2498_11805 [Lentisphaerae bacterium RIFOXYC12_FULL_60_16]|nr:MAG: hypothetical protein A2498_11805 [Lentisphaerae bacterium RIFOXYC12_FULL_60_16]OGV72594.1 MAG: hypothetical protein A2269_01200 [Lentisphaerae bacterium RIFOXYA12_FULL_60_10]OGV77284.1 MAG: hypothetical protein A2340_06150 [Lentisphaerae bacterium RIFOXYB12_FULL_60_10]
MSGNLAYVLINPYTIAKSRTGGVIARYIGRTELNLVAARMFGPSLDLVKEYADAIRNAEPDNREKDGIIAHYVETHYAPDAATGRPRRVMMLLFEGENAVEKVWNVTGPAFMQSGSGGTIRDTYGDYVQDARGAVTYFEPAVLVAPNSRRAEVVLKLWARYSERDGGIIQSGVDVPQGANCEKTLVLLKPDNFRIPSARAGNIIDILSMSNLRIVGIKKFRMTVAQAEKFYGPVQESLRKRFLGGSGAKRIASALGKDFGFEVPEESVQGLCEPLAPLFARQQFDSIVKFMTGYVPSECVASEKTWLGREECLALVYEGVGAVRKIRDILGPTDPTQAKPGSVRREFGSNIMVNAAHASDSSENARREMDIVDVMSDSIRPLVEKHHEGVMAKVRHVATGLPGAGRRFMQFMRDQWKPHTRSMNG